MGCLLTTQQPSTAGKPVDRFIKAIPFPLSWKACAEPNLEELVVKTLTNFRGIRRTKTIGKETAANREWLNNGGWVAVEQIFGKLLERRSRAAVREDANLERQAAHFAAENLYGFGPKQSRNLWQLIGLTRYEIPLDSRLAKWVNKNLSRNIDVKKLGVLAYYEDTLDYIQSVCHNAGVLPCILDAAAFDYLEFNASNAGSTTDSGYVNSMGQVVVRHTGMPGTDHLQSVYQLACSKCGHAYGANGSDIHERKCPECQGGAPGLPLEMEAHA